MDCQEEMAQRCFGYGRWDAPYWFIGPEQGMSKDSRELTFRCHAWSERDRPELDDCMAYHDLLNTLRSPRLSKWGKRDDDWHGEKPNTQRTWARLIQFLIGFGVVTDHLTYQIKEWGSATGDTCVIELSGLSAHNSREKRERGKYLEQRIARMSQELNGSQEFVLLYGRTPECDTAWETLSLGAQQVGSGPRGETISRRGKTLYLRANFHPTGNGQPYEKWKEFGQEVKRLQAVV